MHHTDGLITKETLSGIYGVLPYFTTGFIKHDITVVLSIVIFAFLLGVFLCIFCSESRKRSIRTFTFTNVFFLAATQSYGYCHYCYNSMFHWNMINLILNQ